jgi:hypothetical protein
MRAFEKFFCLLYLSAECTFGCRDFELGKRVKISMFWVYFLKKKKQLLFALVVTFASFELTCTPKNVKSSVNAGSLMYKYRFQTNV